MIRFKFLIFAFIFVGSVAAQVAELMTDRPDQTESSSVVPQNTLQVESGFVLESKSDVISYSYNTTLLRYGLMEKMELRLGLDYLGEKDNQLNINQKGLGPLHAGFKISIAKEDGWKPEVAFLGGLIMPFAAADEFTIKNTAASMRFAFSHTLTESVSIGYNLGAEWDGESTIPAYFYSLVLGLALNDDLGMYCESYGLIIEDGLSEHVLDAGFTYGLLPNLQFDISGGLGINQNALDHFISFGLTFRLPQ